MFRQAQHDRAGGVSFRAKPGNLVETKDGAKRNEKGKRKRGGIEPKIG